MNQAYIPTPGRKGELLSFLADKPTATIKEMADALKITVVNTRMILKELRDKGHVVKHTWYETKALVVGANGKPKPAKPFVPPKPAKKK